MLTKLKSIYADYDQAVQEVRKNARAFDGVFGLGKDPRKDACHDRFYQEVGVWVTEFLAAEPNGEELLEAAMFITEAPTAYEGKECYWYMYASHGHLKPIIPLLSPESRTAVREKMEACYKKRERMPLQKEILKLLSK